MVQQPLNCLGKAIVGVADFGGGIADKSATGHKYLLVKTLKLD